MAHVLVIVTNELPCTLNFPGPFNENKFVCCHSGLNTATAEGILNRFGGCIRSIIWS